MKQSASGEAKQYENPIFSRQNIFSLVRDSQGPRGPKVVCDLPVLPRPAPHTAECRPWSGPPWGIARHPSISSPLPLHPLPFHPKGVPLNVGVPSV